MQEERDYVLGTHDEELARLGLQHRVWRPVVLDCWQRTGGTVAKGVLEVGGGPGYAAGDAAPEARARHAAGQFIALSGERAVCILRIVAATADARALPRACGCDLARIGRRTRRGFSSAYTAYGKRLHDSLGGTPYL